jgi:hypothetical protein
MLAVPGLSPPGATVEFARGLEPGNHLGLIVQLAPKLGYLGR